MVMLQFHDTLHHGHELIVWTRFPLGHGFHDDAGYCIDARDFMPAGSTQRFDPAPHAVFAASRIAYRT
ncbi:hypothetical protein [Burkholderia phage CSP3]|nr:hypothetical protein [Burkholderia phage CSP3]